MKTKTMTRKCVGCGQPTRNACPQCNKPTCNRAVGLCGHAEGICAKCVGQQLLDLSGNVEVEEPDVVEMAEDADDEGGYWQARAAQLGLTFGND